MRKKKRRSENTLKAIAQWAKLMLPIAWRMPSAITVIASFVDEIAKCE